MLKRKNKLAGVHFENVALKALEPDADVSKYFENPEEVFFYDNIPINLKNKHVKAIALSSPTNEKNIVLELQKVPDNFPVQYGKYLTVLLLCCIYTRWEEILCK